MNFIAPVDAAIAEAVEQFDTADAEIAASEKREANLFEAVRRARGVTAMKSIMRNGEWTQVPVTRTREGNGYREEFHDADPDLLALTERARA